MKIKTQGGKVITKGGKVSCECCGEPPLPCCMFPSSQLNTGYSQDELPDAVTVDGTSFNRSGTSYGDTTNGVIFESGVWAKYNNGARSERPCLIQSGVVDQFDDVYYLDLLFTPSQNEAIPLTRVDLCEWRNEEIEGEALIEWVLIFTAPSFAYVFNRFDGFLQFEGFRIVETGGATPKGDYFDPESEFSVRVS